MFLSDGHRNVRILNGGLKKWRAEGRAVESGEVKPKPASFKASYDPKRVRSIEQMIANVESRAEQVIDARAAGAAGRSAAARSVRQPDPGSAHPALEAIYQAGPVAIGGPLACPHSDHEPS